MIEIISRKSDSCKFCKENERSKIKNVKIIYEYEDPKAYGYPEPAYWSKEIDTFFCPKCGSRRAEDGMVYCGICKIKNRQNANKLNHKSKRTRAEQYDGVSCAWCKAPVVEGRYFCADCLDKKRKNTEKARAAIDWARHPFRHPFRGGAA